ncbi:MAG: LytTR family DNA-binding domain-containing protein, partial [Pseudomonadales bacterium]|nr:LytTR family DNA-binding domain-containing protein [Pseudomonadales bacterium]
GAPEGPDPALLEALAARLGGASRERLNWLRVTNGDEVTLLAVDDVLCFQADRKYTSAVTASGEHLLRQSISELEARLDPDRFWRIHRSTIVAVGAIESARRDLRGRYRVRVRGLRDELPVSAAHAHLFRGA